MTRRWRRRRALAFLLLAASAACRETDRAEPVVDADGRDPDLTAMADSLLPHLERLSHLPAIGPLEIRRESTERMREFVERQLAEELPPHELNGVRGTYALLGLIPDTLDLRRLLMDLYTEQIVGYYDPDRKTLFIMEGVPAQAVRPVLAHELVHAVQDQHTNLDSLIARERGNDRQTAAQAAIEGHATLVMFALLAEEVAGGPVDPVTLPNPAAQLRPALESPGGQFPVFRDAPRIVRETLLFPYVGGATFVQELWRSQPVGARTAPLDTLMPQSTEQVIDPVDRFLTGRDTPTDVRFDPTPQWQVLYENTLGALETRLFLEEHIGMVPAASAEGWDGDRYRLLQSPAGELALVWYSVWDDQPSADRFAAAAERVASTRLRGGGVERMQLDGRPLVRVIIADTAILLEVPPGGVTLAAG